MLSARLAGGSVLLSERGWVSADIAPAELAVLGAGRNGRLEARAVRVVPSRPLDVTAFLGTSSTFAEFSPSSRILSNDGSRLLDELISSGDAGGTRFETPAELPDAVGWAYSAPELWKALSSAAAYRNGNRVAIPCSQANPAASDEFECRNIGGRTYAVLDKERVDRSMARDPSGTLTRILSAWLRNERTGSTDLERSLHGLTIHYVSALRRSGTSYRLRFDSLQHTAYVYVEDEDQMPPPVTKGACAFLSAAGGMEFLMSWEGTGWCPVVSGFLMEPA